MRGFARPVRKRQMLAKKRSPCPHGMCMIFGERPPLLWPTDWGCFPTLWKRFSTMLAATVQGSLASTAMLGTRQKPALHFALGLTMSMQL